MNRSIHIDREWLENEYREKFRTAEDIAKELGCSAVTVTRKLRQFGIKRKYWPSVVKKNFSKEWLEEQYAVKCLPVEEIARMAGCSTHTIRKWLVDWQVKRFSQEVYQKIIETESAKEETMDLRTSTKGKGSGSWSRGMRKETNPEMKAISMGRHRFFEMKKAREAKKHEN